MKLGVWLGDDYLYALLQRMEDIRTSARVTVHTFSTFVRSRSFLAQKASYWCELLIANSMKSRSIRLAEHDN